MSFTAILVLIEYYGYFMLGEVKMFLWIFINDSHIKCMSAQDRGKRNREKQHGGRGMTDSLFTKLMKIIFWRWQKI